MLLLSLLAAACGPEASDSGFSEDSALDRAIPAGTPLPDPMKDSALAPTSADLTGWSLDAASLVVTSPVDGDSELFLVRGRSDTSWVRLTTSPGLDHQAAWTPDGSAILFHSTRRAVAAAADADSSEAAAAGLDVDIWALQPGDSTAPVMVFGSPEPDYLVSVSPDGRRIAFLSRRVAADVPDGERGHIYLLPWSGVDEVAPDQVPVRITREPVDASLGARWHPNGVDLFMVHRRGGAGPTRAVLLSADGTRERILVENGDFNYTPAPSPDGTRLAWSAARDDSVRVMIATLDGSMRRTLVTGSTSVDAYYVHGWTPDGAWIVADRWDEAARRTDAVLISPEDGRVEKLFDTDRPTSAAAFRPVPRRPIDGG